MESEKSELKTEKKIRPRTRDPRGRNRTSNPSRGPSFASDYLKWRTRGIEHLESVQVVHVFHEMCVDRSKDRQMVHTHRPR